MIRLIDTKTKAFTLIELMVVISIIGMLSSIILVSLNNTRDKANLAKGIAFETQLSRAWSADNLVARYNFDDGAIPFTDSSGNGNPSLTAGGSTPVSTAGIKSKAFASNGAIVSNYNLSYFPIKSFNILNGSLSFYMKPQTSGSLYNVVSMNGVAIQLQADTLKLTSPSMSNSIEPNKWHHILLSWGYDGSNNTRLYVDGNMVKSSPSLPSFGTGNLFGITIAPTPGSIIDEVTIYSKSIQSP